MIRVGGAGSAVVIGASLAGLFSAVALAGHGYEVTILERDRLPVHPVPRKGVPQSAQPHVLLHRGMLAAESLLPGLRADLLAAGATCFDGGAMPWLGEYGWLDTTIGGYPVVSLTRPLLEHRVRRQVVKGGRVGIVERVDVRGLRRAGQGWMVRTATEEVPADLVVDASGRNSRLPHWLSELGLAAPEPEVVDAHLGYACRLYRAPEPLPLDVGIVIVATPDSPFGGLALPVEHGQWIVMAGGLGDHRPGRDPDGFRRFFSLLRDRALVELVDLLEPVDEVRIHRQTQNRRYRYEAVADWPDGLLAVGDSLAAFNPIYGQGITVAACQAQTLGRSLSQGLNAGRRLQRRLAADADRAWTLATAADLRQTSSDQDPSPVDRAVDRWVQHLAWLMGRGDLAATVSFRQVYNLMAPPQILFSPLLVATAVRSWLQPSPPVPRPAALEALTAQHRRRYGVAA